MWTLLVAGGVVLGLLVLLVVWSLLVMAAKRGDPEMEIYGGE